MTKEIGTIEEALRDIKAGKVILVIDDPENSPAVVEHLNALLSK